MDTRPPQPGQQASSAFCDATDQQLVKAEPTKVRDNLTKRERRALKRLIRRRDIVIKPADKGGFPEVSRTLSSFHLIILPAGGKSTTSMTVVDKLS